MKTLHPILDAVGPELKKSVAKKPSKRWRNKFYAPKQIDWGDAPVTEAGETLWGENIWPSREVAEAAALKSVEQCRLQSVELVWLGAFPIDDEQPQ